MVITEKMQKFLRGKEFVIVGTSDLNSQPNAAPKFVVKVDDGFIYLADHVIGKTFQNLKVNPKISISTVDMKTLEGYQVNGAVSMITEGPQYKELLKLMVEREVHHSAQRVIGDIRGTQKYDNYEVTFPEKVVIFKVKCEGITKISATGKLSREE